MNADRPNLVQIDLNELNVAIAAAVVRSRAVKTEEAAPRPADMPATVPSLPSAPPDLMRAARLARSYLRSRRARDAMFPSELFGEAAWDIMLDLFAAHVESRQVAVSSACIASGVPPTTALRWIGKLLDMRLIRRVDDPDDRRRSWLVLAPSAIPQIEQWLLRTFPEPDCRNST